MKRAPTILCLIGIILGFTAAAQGTFLFSTTPKAAQSARIVDALGNPVTGTNYLIDVVVLNPATGGYDGKLTRVTTSGEVPFEPVYALAGAGAGLFAGGTIKVSFIAPGAPAQAEIRVWAGGGTYNDALLRNETCITIPALGGIVGAVTNSPASIVPPFQGMGLAPLTPKMQRAPARMVRDGTNVVLAWTALEYPYDKFQLAAETNVVDFFQMAHGPVPNWFRTITTGGVEGDYSLFLTPLTRPKLSNGWYTVPLNTQNLPNGYYQVIGRYHLGCPP